MKRILTVLFCTLFFATTLRAQERIEQWHRAELEFFSSQGYSNPIYDIEIFRAEFTAPSGRQISVNGFWYGDNEWRIRFMPDELGTWSYKTVCSDVTNTKLHNISGAFECIPNRNTNEIYQRGKIVHPTGRYHLAYTDNTPFFYLGCTAWNGALFSTVEEWERYLSNRKHSGYSVIQFVTTQWRGAPYNAEKEVAYTGIDTIKINPGFFKRIDEKIDRINDYGLVAAPVMLWALPVAAGRKLSPGYILPSGSAVKLAKYILARYDAHHVVWTLGGDGKFIDQYEERWKYIGREVFKEPHQNVVTTHPQGKSWYGNAYNNEPWLDMISYQTGHQNTDAAIKWKVEGPVVQGWPSLAPRPIMDTEPTYENEQRTNSQEVRNSTYWSIFSTPVSGTTYGSHVIWPWLRKGEYVWNHAKKDEAVTAWDEAIYHGGSIQIGFISRFIKRFEWWNLFPANELLVEQPGKSAYDRWQMVLASNDGKTILVYVPKPDNISIYNTGNHKYKTEWFFPATNTYTKAEIRTTEHRIETSSPGDSDAILILQRK